MKQKYLKPFLWLIGLYWQTSKPSFIWVFCKAIFDGLINIFVVYLSAQLIASVSAVAFQKASPNSVYFWLFALLAAEIIRSFLGIINGLVTERLNQMVEISGSEHFIRKVYELSQEQFDNQEFNTKFDRARDGFYRLTGSINTLTGTLSSVIGLVGSIGAVFAVSPILSLIIIATLIPTTIIERMISNRYDKLNRETEPYERTSGRIRWMLTDPLYMPEIRLMQAFKKLLSIWRTNMDKTRNLSFSNSKKNAKLDAIIYSIKPLLDFGVNVYVFNLLVGGIIGFERFIFLRGMLEQTTSNINWLSYSLKSVYDDLIALRNYSEVHNTLPAIPDGRVKPSLPLTIEFKNVSFSYPGSDNLAIDNISFTLKPGEKLALVGENGAGKTTIIKLLLRQYKPTDGKILVNGRNILDISQDDYLSAISSLGQEVHTVGSLSIKDNLTIGINKPVSDKQIYKVADMVDATRYLKKLPYGLNSRLDSSYDKGMNLSIGQKQRLGIARTLLRSGDIIILDEPTSAIDAKAEHFIFNSIFNHYADKSMLIISHRFSTVRKANEILVIDKGRIVEKGSHNELLKAGGVYNDMFDKQAEGYR